MELATAVDLRDKIGSECLRIAELIARATKLTYAALPEGQDRGRIQLFGIKSDETTTVTDQQIEKMIQEIKLSGARHFCELFRPKSIDLWAQVTIGGALVRGVGTFDIASGKTIFRFDIGVF